MRLRSIVLSIALAAGVLMAAQPAQAYPVEVSWAANSVDTVYPVADGYVDTIGFSWTVNQPSLLSLTLQIWRAQDQTVVFETALDSEATSYTWDGHTTGGPLAAAGGYIPVLIGHNGTDPDTADQGNQFTVSGKKLVAKTWTKQVTAAGSLKTKFVGGCSTLAKPGKKLGTGSLGYYSLSKCTRTSNGAGVVATVHGLTLPSALRPGKLSISTYGAAVKPGSTATLVPLASNGNDAIDAAVSMLGSAKGWHAGKSTPATPMMTSTRLIRWGVVAFGGSRYDVKYFKVVYHYTALV